MSNYASVDLPLNLQRYAGVAPIVLYHRCEDAGLMPIYTLKPEGNHVARWWVDIQVQGRLLRFGSTLCDKVNPTPHIWCMGSPKILETGKQLLARWLRDLGRLTSIQSTIKATFAARNYGIEYQDVTKNETVTVYALPWVDCEQWCLVGTIGGCGWCPEQYVY